MTPRSPKPTTRHNNVLNPPDLPDGSWKVRGKCYRSGDTHLFFEAKHVAEAMTVCAGCPVRDKCRDYALETGASGIWGGQLFFTTPEARAAAGQTPARVADNAERPNRKT